MQKKVKHNKTLSIMKAEMIYNEAVEKLTNLVKDMMIRLYNNDKQKGIIDADEDITKDGYVVDVLEYGKDLSDVMYYNDDICHFNTDYIDVACIWYDGKNILLFDDEQRELYFVNLPLNSMVFIAITLEDICNEMNV